MVDLTCDKNGRVCGALVDLVTERFGAACKSWFCDRAAAFLKNMAAAPLGAFYRTKDAVLGA